ncbi:TVP38/TMEM64 family protein [Blastochloris viridis]|nr:VTT domain-containing protein [Blastochloris viridis]ALK10745.1 TVP38/TMEM64 family inner membrane protein YdjZ [Blastochloris viridis]CUU43407.1 TVP38/TMEM64 family inner membrane protein ydjZ [Blastochloris viridis]
MIEGPAPRRPGPALRRWRRLLPAAAVAAAMVAALALGGHRYLSLAALVDHHAALEALVASHPLTAAAVFVAGYAAVTALSLPGAAVMTLLGGLLFGWLGGTLASLVAATAGATAVFLIARTSFGDDLARRAGGTLAQLAGGFQRNALSYLLFLRLVPAFPFWLVNLVPALLGVRLSTYVVATAIGILPATLVFALIGSGLGGTLKAERAAVAACVARGGAPCEVTLSVGDFLTPGFIAGLTALSVLALLPLLVKRLRRPAAPAQRPT